MAEMLFKERSSWYESGILDTEVLTFKKGKEIIKQTQYKHLHQLGKTIEDVDNALEEYVWNDMFATMNIVQLTVTDTAYSKNVENF